MHSHLVAVEVGVERRADERVDLDGLAFDEHRLEGLNAEAVKRWRAVQEHGVLLDDLGQHVPHRRLATLDHALGRLDVLRQLGVDEALHDERLEQLERHQLGQTALVQLERRADDDDRTARVVDALAEQVLTEPALLALEHVGQRLERAVTGTGDRTAATTVVEQRVDGLLQHALLVVHDDLGRTEVEQSLEAVVAVDDAAVQVVEVGGREAATVELHHRAQVRRDDRHGLEDHRARVVDALALLVATVERRDDLEALDGLLLALHRQRLAAVGRLDAFAELDLFVVEVDAVDERGDGLGAHAAFEVLAVAVGELAPQQFVFDDLAGVQAAELVPRALDQVEFEVGALADAGEVLVGHLLAGLDLAVLGAGLLEVGQLGFERLEATIDVEVALLLDLAELFEQFGLEGGLVDVALSSSTQVTRLAAK